MTDKPKCSNPECVDGQVPARRGDLATEVYVEGDGEVGWTADDKGRLLDVPDGAFKPCPTCSLDAPGNEGGGGDTVDSFVRERYAELLNRNANLDRERKIRKGLRAWIDKASFRAEKNNTHTDPLFSAAYKSYPIVVSKGELLAELDRGEGLRIINELRTRIDELEADKLSARVDAMNALDASRERGGEVMDNRYITVIVSGIAKTAQIAVDQRLSHLVEAVLKSTGHAGQSLNGWELRTMDGRLLEQTIKARDARIVDGMTLYLSPRAGIGATCGPDAEGERVPCPYLDRCPYTHPVDRPGCPGENDCTVPAHPDVPGDEGGGNRENDEVIVQRALFENTIAKVTNFRAALAAERKRADEWERRWGELKAWHADKRDRLMNLLPGYSRTSDSSRCAEKIRAHEMALAKMDASEEGK